MSDRDRRVRQNGGYIDFPVVEIDVHGNTQIDKGDLIFMDRVDGLRSKGTSTATNYGFPFSKISGATVTLFSNKTLAQENFFGVAAWHSDSGVTERIAVYTAGLFNYDLKNSRTAKPLYVATAAGSGVTLYDQKITIESSSTQRIGLIAEYGTYKSSVDVSIGTLMRPIDSTIY